MILVLIVAALFAAMLLTQRRRFRSFPSLLANVRGGFGQDAVSAKLKAFINCSNGGAAPALASTGQGVVLARTGAGVYTLTFDTELGGGPAGATGDIIPVIQSLSAATLTTCIITSTNVLTLTFSGDTAFAALIFEASPSGT